MSDADAQVYGQALANALRHFAVERTQKAIDFATLAFCVFRFEMPRITLSMQRTRQGGQGLQPRGPAQVFQFRNPAPQSPAGAPPPAQPPVNPPHADGLQGTPPIADPPDPVEYGGGIGGELQ